MNVLLHPADQPLFRLVLRASGCDVELRVNDVPLLQESSGGAFHVDIPVNEWLYQGANQLTLRLIAPGGAFPPGATATLALEHRRLRGLHRQTVECGRLEAPCLANNSGHDAHDHSHHEHDHDHDHDHDDPDDPPTQPDAGPDEDDDMPLIALPGVAEDIHWKADEPAAPRGASVTLEASFHLPPPWPQCPWGQAAVQEGGAGAQYIMTRQTRALWEILNRRDTGACLQILAGRLAALAASYQLTSAECSRQLFLPDILPDPAWELQPFPAGPLHVEAAAQGRLLRASPVHDIWPLRLVHKGRGVEVSVDAWWMLSGGIWQIIR